MANTQLKDMSAITSPADTDLLYVQSDPAGTPADNKFTFANLKALLKTYFDSVTTTLTNKTLTTPTITNPVLNATNPTAQTYSPAGAGTATLDLSLANHHDITMPTSGNITIALSNATNNKWFEVSITWAGSGTPGDVTFFSTIRWPAGVAPTLTKVNSKRDRFLFTRTGSGTYDGMIVAQNF